MMDGPGLMVHGGLYPKKETDTEREWCCLNLGHHNNIAPGASESAERGRYTLMFSLSEGMIDSPLEHTIPHGPRVRERAGGRKV